MNLPLLYLSSCSCWPQNYSLSLRCVLYLSLDWKSLQTAQEYSITLRMEFYQFRFQYMDFAETEKAGEVFYIQPKKKKQRFQFHINKYSTKCFCFS